MPSPQFRRRARQTTRDLSHGPGRMELFNRRLAAGYSVSRRLGAKAIGAAMKGRPSLLFHRLSERVIELVGVHAQTGSKAFGASGSAIRT